jgi:hypothetical protein
MNKIQFAALINGREYREELTDAEEAQAKLLGLVVIFGASDDLIEFRGAISDEGDCYKGGTFKIDAEGVLASYDDIEDEDEMADYFKRKDSAIEIEALWSPAEQNCAWSYKATVPHATFNVMEGDDLYCIGMVIDINDLPKAAA